MLTTEKTLICTVGLPSSGKSTWAREQIMRAGVAVVNPDAIRLAMHGKKFEAKAEGYVWATVTTMIRALFLAGHDTVILDATNVTKAARKKWIKPDEWKTYFHEVKTDKATCLNRCPLGDELRPVIERMDEEFEPLEATEERWLGNTRTHCLCD